MNTHPEKTLDDSLDELMTPIEAPLCRKTQDKIFQEILSTPENQLSQFSQFLRKLAMSYNQKDILEAEQILFGDRPNTTAGIQSYYGKMRLHELTLVQQQKMCAEEFDFHWQTILLNEALPCSPQ